LTAQRWLLRLTGLVTIAILARTLDPHDFGVVAIASTVLPFIYLLSDLGLSTYLVQAKDPDRRVVSTAFWFSVVAGTVLGLAVFVAVPFVVQIMKAPEAGAVLRVLLLSVPIVVAGSVPNALLKRRMAFKKLAVQSAAAAAVGQVTAIAVALAGGGAWALVTQTLTASFVTTVLAWVSSRWRPSFEFAWHEFKAMAAFGYKVVAVEAVGVVRNWAETAIVAISLGTAALGYLSIAQRLVLVAQDLGGSAVVPVATVALAKVRDTPERLRSAYLRASALTYVAATPLLTFITVAAPLIVPLFFGAQWSASVPVTRGLAVAGILTLGAMLDNGLFYALGRAGRWLAYSSVTDALTVAATAIAVSWGLTAVAWAFVGVALLATAARWVLVGRAIGVAVPTLAWSFGTSAVCAAGSALAGLGVLALTHGVRPIVSAALVGVVIVTVQIALVRVVEPQVFRQAVELGPIPQRVRDRVVRWSRLRETSAAGSA
jgi:O-antigen/teichoic acid export membrane protein